MLHMNLKTITPKLSQYYQAFRAFLRQNKKRLKISKIIPTKSNLTLVTSAVHMTRAKMLFEKAGFNIVAFPIKFFSGHKTTPMSFIPSASALHRSTRIYREFQGRLFYRLKYSLK